LAFRRERMTILVIDDNENVLNVVERLLSTRGHTVLTASDGVGAESVIQEHGHSPDLLVVDVVLSGEDGIGCARELRAEHGAMKVVFMTGTEKWVPRALRTGFGPVLRKPFTGKDLHKAIDEIASGMGAPA